MALLVILLSSPTDSSACCAAASVHEQPANATGGAGVRCWRSAHLTKRYGGLVAVKDLSFVIRPGEILGLIGPNGSGKSTAMKTILGVEQRTSGSVKLDGVEIGGLPCAQDRATRRRPGLPALSAA